MTQIAHAKQARTRHSSKNSKKATTMTLKGHGRAQAAADYDPASSGSAQRPSAPRRDMVQQSTWEAPAPDGVARPTKEWAAMIFMKPDISLERAAVADVEEMKAVRSLTGAYVGVQVERLNDVERLEIVPGGDLVHRSPNPRPRGIAQAIGGFAKWTQEAFPATHRLAVMWGHTSGVGFDLAIPQDEPGADPFREWEPAAAPRVDRFGAVIVPEADEEAPIQMMRASRKRQAEDPVNLTIQALVDSVKLMRPPAPEAAVPPDPPAPDTPPTVDLGGAGDGARRRTVASRAAGAAGSSGGDVSITTEWTNAPAAVADALTGTAAGVTTGSTAQEPEAPPAEPAAAARPKLDVLGLDSCYMSSVECGYELQEHVSYLVASESLMSNQGWNYRAVLNAVATPGRTTPRAVGRAIVKHVTTLQGPASISMLTLENLMALGPAFEVLVAALQERIKDPMERAVLKIILSRVAYMKVRQFLDVRDLCHKLIQNFDGDVANGAAGVLALLTEDLVFHRASGLALGRLNGLSIFYPYVRASAVRASCRDLDEVNAVVAPGAYRRLKFVEETGWGDLLDRLFGD